MKVGIATVFDSSNMGSFLQALAMQEMVKSNGDIPVMIRTRSPMKTCLVYLGYQNKIFRPAFIKFLMKILLSPRKLLSSIQKYLIYKHEWRAFDSIIPMTRTGGAALDVLLLGSDEIWNAAQYSFQNPALYGAGISSNRKYGYAVSAGNMPKDGWVKYPELLHSLSKLDGILVRDDYTEDILESNGLVSLGKICDPTLQVDIRKYMRSTDEVKLPDKDYIAVYSYHIDDKVQHAICNFAQKHGLRTVAVSLPHSWCDEYINCAPLDFGAILKNAKYVYTTTFHGTIFSALYHTKFASCPFSQKVTDVLNILGLNQYIVSPDASVEDMEKVLLSERNYGEMEKKIVLLRRESQAYYNRLLHPEREGLR